MAFRKMYWNNGVKSHSMEIFKQSTTDRYTLVKHLATAEALNDSLSESSRCQKPYNWTDEP